MADIDQERSWSLRGALASVRSMVPTTVRDPGFVTSFSFEKWMAGVSCAPWLEAGTATRSLRTVRQSIRLPCYLRDPAEMPKPQRLPSSLARKR